MTDHKPLSEGEMEPCEAMLHWVREREAVRLRRVRGEPARIVKD